MKETFERVSPNALIVVVATAITLMQMGSAYWVRQTTAAQRAIDIEAAVKAHMRDPNPHNSDLGRHLDANQRDVMKRLAVLEALMTEQHARLDRIQGVK